MSVTVEEALDKFIKDRMSFQTALGKVLAVNKTECTCTVQMVYNDDLVFEDVRLRALADGNVKGFILFPAIDSYVIVSMLENQQSNLYVSMFSDIDTFKILNDSESLFEILEDLLTAIKAITVPTNVGNSGTPLNFATFDTIKTRIESLIE